MNRSLACAAATIALGLTACTTAAPAGAPVTDPPVEATAPTAPAPTPAPAPTTTSAPTTTLPPTTAAAPTTTLDPMIEFQALLDRYHAVVIDCLGSPETCDWSSVVKPASNADEWHDSLVSAMLSEGWYALPAPGSAVTVEKVLRISPTSKEIVYCRVATEVDMHTHGTPDRGDDTPFSTGATSYRIELYLEKSDNGWLVSNRAVLGKWFGESQCAAA